MRRPRPRPSPRAAAPHRRAWRRWPIAWARRCAARSRRATRRSWMRPPTPPSGRSRRASERARSTPRFRRTSSASSSDARAMSRIAGIDVGGTFTDLIVVDDASGEVRIAKVPTTVDNQAFGVLAALDAAGVDPASLDAIVHGTTTTTNAMLERKIATVGLITTRGFRDVLELGRRTRPTPYGLKGRFVPLIAREYRLEV